ncbi:MAG: AmmeMemoRadiSam system protein A [Candidatus Aminicenantaceae bacterium]
MGDLQLNIDQQRFLLKLARDAIRYHFESGKPPPIAVAEGALKEKRGAFVTLKRKEELRGCIGYPLPHDPLYLTITEAAVMAATQDHRFTSLTLEELPNVQIEISVLTLPRKIESVSEIVLGEHGIIVTQGMYRGLLLPQVPVEWNWDLDTYLQHGCLKAGLEENAWKKGAEIQIFSAQVFSE